MTFGVLVSDSHRGDHSGFLPARSANYPSRVNVPPLMIFLFGDSPEHDEEERRPDGPNSSDVVKNRRQVIEQFEKLHGILYLIKLQRCDYLVLVLKNLTRSWMREVSNSKVLLRRNE